ncbi:S26 family signal peptidase [Candidatus Woesearchaeota archaeon]|nr:S26 family signal peptidase [Candidatus Woesearchaeota archaeon]
MSKKNSNYDYFLVKGGSMLPTIKQDQKVKIIKTKDVKIGDIIVFKGNSKKNKNFRIIHRVVKINGNKVITKGDNRHNCDMPVISKQILGKIIKIGNKKVDTSYYNFINPFIAKISYYSMKINPASYFGFKLVPKFLHDFKISLIGDRDLYIERTILFFLKFPYKINNGIFKLLKK